MGLVIDPAIIENLLYPLFYVPDSEACCSATACQKITVVAALGKVSAKAYRPDNRAYRCSTPHCPSPTSFPPVGFLASPHRCISTHRSLATDSSQQLHGAPGFVQVEVHSSERTGRLDGPWPSTLRKRVLLSMFRELKGLGSRRQAELPNL